MELRGPRIVLRPFREDEIDAVWTARRAPDGFSAWTGRVDEAAFRRRLSRSGRFWNGRLDLAIESEGRLVGELDARQPSNALPPGVYEIGIALFGQDDRGRGLGGEAVELMTEYLFANGGAERVQASTAVDNVAMRRVLEKLGYACEGVMRGFMPSLAGRDDYALYGVTRRAWRERG